MNQPVCFAMTVAIPVLLGLAGCSNSPSGTPYSDSGGQEVGQELQPVYLQDGPIEFEGVDGARRSISYLTKRLHRVEQALQASGGEDRELKRQANELRQQISAIRDFLEGSSPNGESTVSPPTTSLN